MAAWISKSIAVQPRTSAAGATPACPSASHFSIFSCTLQCAAPRANAHVSAHVPSPDDKARLIKTLDCCGFFFLRQPLPRRWSTRGENRSVPFFLHLFKKKQKRQIKREQPHEEKFATPVISTPPVVRGDRNWIDDNCCFALVGAAGHVNEVINSMFCLKPKPPLGRLRQVNVHESSHKHSEEAPVQPRGLVSVEPFSSGLS